VLFRVCTVSTTSAGGGPGAERSVVLLLRVWCEADGAFRARVVAPVRQPGGAPGEHTVALASTPRELVDAVHHWLGGLCGG
jgi:hypothetical protein